MGVDIINDDVILLFHRPIRQKGSGISGYYFCQRESHMWHNVSTIDPFVYPHALVCDITCPRFPRASLLCILHFVFPSVPQCWPHFDIRVIPPPFVQHSLNTLAQYSSTILLLLNTQAQYNTPAVTIHIVQNTFFYFCHIQRLVILCRPKLFHWRIPLLQMVHQFSQIFWNILGLYFRNVNVTLLERFVFL